MSDKPQHCDNCDPSFMGCWLGEEPCRKKPIPAAEYLKKIAESFWRDHEKKVIEKYGIETIRHAANAIFNKLNEAYHCGLESDQGKTALFDAQALADVIVRSEAAEKPIGPNL